MTDRIAYLGPEGTFTETAARFVVGDVASGSGRIDPAAEQLLACGDVIEVLRAVEAGEADRGVVPIENTLEGSVTATLDALAFDTDLLVHGELELPVSLVAAGVGELTLDEVAEVHSHPIALSACRRWLSNNLPGAERVVSASTARAAADIAERGGAR
ncbi:MAG: prephenate dehydratase, partial [Actinobacteria bacterium]|nr:prephenate dehydratase [Actinomycetota bacterium]